MIKLNDELAQEYLAESREQLDALEADLLAMQKGGAEIDAELANRVFLEMHRITGGAAFFDLVKIGELAHRAEDVLALVRSHQMVPTPDRVHVLLRATDRLREMILDPDTSNQEDIFEELADLAGIQPDSGDADGVAGSPAAEQASHGGGPLRILLVEDDFASRLLLRTFLSRYGECHIAVNGREAVDTFRLALERGLRFDLICMDIMMPEMDGREAVRHMRDLEATHGIRSTAGAKIIMTTAVDDIREVARCFMELCDEYLVKPIDLGKLLGHMRYLQLVQ